jgi:hypothetical protein
MGLSKLKAALAQALKDGNKKLSTKIKEEIKQGRKFKPGFPGQHRGY